MNEPFDRLLRQTLNDFRLSRGEKRVLARTVAELGSDDHTLGLLRSRAFAIAREELLGPEARQVLEWLEDVNRLLIPTGDDGTDEAPAEAYFSPGDDVPARIVRWIGSTRQRLDICVFTITDDRVSDAIRDAAQRRVRVRIISDNDKSEDLGSDIERLERLGIPIRVDRTEYHMHHKFALFDSRRLLTGSYNWTRSAADRNQENVVVTSDRRLVGVFQKAFDALWRELE